MSHTYPMEFTMKVNMDNAAFADRFQLVKLLDRVRMRYLSYADSEGTLTDWNGNTVGSWEITGPNPHEEEEE